MYMYVFRLLVEGGRGGARLEAGWGSRGAKASDSQTGGSGGGAPDVGLEVSLCR